MRIFYRNRLSPSKKKRDFSCHVLASTIIPLQAYNQASQGGTRSRKIRNSVAIRSGPAR